MFASRRFLTRRLRAFAGPVVGGALALAGACVVSASAVMATESATGFVPAPPPPPTTAYVSGDLRRVLNAPDLVVAGKTLNVALLRRFYERHGFEPVWTNRQAQANALFNAVMRAGDHGLSPDLFHANLLLSAMALPPLDRELLLSDAFLSYADALARGAVPIERRRDDEVLAPEPIDVTAALDTAITSPEPAAVIEGLAPSTPTYMALRQALLNLHAGVPVGGRNPTARLRQIEVNLERERWLPRRLPADRVWVNVADEKVMLYRDNRQVFATRVIVGQDALHNQSPEFEVPISAILFNPPWNIPQDITDNEIMPKISQDPNYLARHNMVMLPNGGLQQLAGPTSGLGQLMFLMQNRFDVYLHDTPSKNLFAREDRRISHGCIRVEKPRELAALVMQQPIEAIDQTIATGATIESKLAQPMPVFVVYETAFADADGRLQFRPDVYGRDAEIWPHLDPERRPVAERELPGQRGG